MDASGSVDGMLILLKALALAFIVGCVVASMMLMSVGTFRDMLVIFGAIFYAFGLVTLAIAVIMWKPE
jgi:hypothetical protein